MNKDEKIKQLINLKYGSVKVFSNKIGLPYTTVDSILKRGILNSNVHNALTICRALDIDINEFETTINDDFLHDVFDEKIDIKYFIKETLALLERTDIDENNKTLLTKFLKFVCSNK